MNLYRIGFIHNEMETRLTMLLVLAESANQARVMWPVAEERNRILCRDDGAILASMSAGIYARLGDWNGYVQPQVKFHDEIHKNDWQMSDGEIKRYIGSGRVGLPLTLVESYNLPLPLWKVCEALNAFDLLEKLPVPVQDVIGKVFLGHHQHPADNHPNRWLTIAAGGANRDVCISQGRGDSRSPDVIYRTMLTSALAALTTRVMRSSEIHEQPRPKAIEMFIPKNNPPVCDFVADGTPMPVVSFVEWIRSANDDYHNQYAALLEKHFESLQFMRFPDGNAVAVVGKLLPASGGYRMPLCVTYFEGVNGILKAVHELIREHQRMSAYPDTFDYLTSINPNAESSS